VIKEINDQKGINTIEFNPHQICFAYGGKDKTIKYFNLQTFNLLGKTNIDRLPIERIAFDNKGQNIFSATNEALKYWEVNNTTGLNLISMNESFQKYNIHNNICSH
jgi:WD40 repeat protein